jgi:2-polyprenyl-3-methyl-5-hydroxy-6-metoxy-1,4-benzoquinol methylase
MGSHQLKQRIGAVIQQFNRGMPETSVRLSQSSSLEPISSVDNAQLDTHWMIFFKDSGYGGRSRYLVKRRIRKLLRPFLALLWLIFKRQIFFNGAVRDALQRYAAVSSTSDQRMQLLENGLRNLEETIVSSKAVEERIEWLEGQIVQVTATLEQGYQALRDELASKEQIEWLEGQIGQVTATLRNELASKEQIEWLEGQIGQAADTIEQREQALRDQMQTEIREHVQQRVGDILAGADSYTGPKAKTGLWFNEPIMVQYDAQQRASWAGTTERIIEKAWIFRHLSGALAGAKLLDVGCSESLLAIELASNGFQVTGIDIRPYPLLHPNFEFLICDICKSNLPSSQYDIAIALSTIEHVGLGWYSDPRGDTYDFMAIEEIYRLLKPGGQLLMTVPFGQSARTPVHRIYNSESLRHLLRNFTVEKAEYGIKTDGRTWVAPVAEEIAAQQRHDPASYAPSAVAMTICSKPEAN